MKDKAQIAVIGAGLMGHGIAQVFACAGHLVTVYDTNSSALSSLRERITNNLDDLGLDRHAAELVYAVEDFGECVAAANVVFEAGPENLDFKQKVFEKLQLLAPPTALLASNTSVIPITAIMKASTVPSAAPLPISASTMGMMPAALVYMGTPISTASGTDHQASLPIKLAMKSSGT